MNFFDVGIIDLGYFILYGFYYNREVFFEVFYNGEFLCFVRWLNEGFINIR